MTRARIVGSALWSAWGDALGFATELADDVGLVRLRTGFERVTDTIAWRRRIGGRSGPTVDIPAGCYSDDTQLRLATARSIGRDGSFDVAAFAKVELPAFLAYGLGVGRGTRLAAKNLGKPSVSWNSNFYSSKSAKYMGSGGNGGAMRVQPHVWVATHRERHESWVPQLLRNVLTTHGHPRAIAGAVFHAITVAATIDEGVPPDPTEWRKIAEWLPDVSAIIHDDEELSVLWLPEWERQGGTELNRAMQEVSDEFLDLIRTISAMCVSKSATWADLVEAAGGFDPATRGSGVGTSLLAACLAHRGASEPDAAIVTAVNTLGSDTDTIATMAGAILGAAVEGDPPGPVMDHELIRNIATWLETRSRGTDVGRFRYPDLLHWTVPRSQVDLVGQINGNLALAGLDVLRPAGKEYPAGGSADAIYQWAHLEFGQTVLVRMRAEPRPLPIHAHPPSLVSNVVAAKEDADLRLFRDQHPRRQTTTDRARTDRAHTDGVARIDSRSGEPLSIEVAIDLVIGSSFPADVIGECLLELASQPSGLEKSVAFISGVVKAFRDRLDEK